MIWNVLLTVALTPASLQDPCLVLRNDRIYARDVATSVPAFTALPSDLILGYAPDPGARRILTGAALAKVAKSYGMELELPHDVCFELRSSELSPKAICAAMLEELRRNPQKCDVGDGVKVEVLEWGPEMAPIGEVVFPNGCLQLLPNRTSAGRDLWRGYVSYGMNRRFAIWARARIAISATEVVAVSDIDAGTPIRPEQVLLVKTEVSSLDNRQARRLEEAVGYASRRAIRAGAALGRNQLYRVPDVGKGDIVQVEVATGSARLALEGRADSAGSIGAVIWVKNPTSGKSFRAKVTGKGMVAVITTAGGIREE
jgi:flagella basal body P-ring formation protein FlgA